MLFVLEMLKYVFLILLVGGIAYTLSTMRKNIDG